MNGALYPAVTDQRVLAQEIPWVPVSQQQRVAARLTAQLAAVEQTRRAAQAQLAEIERLPARLLAEAFGP